MLCGFCNKPAYLVFYLHGKGSLNVSVYRVLDCSDLTPGIGLTWILFQGFPSQNILKNLFKLIFVSKITYMILKKQTIFDFIIINLCYHFTLFDIKTIKTAQI